MLFNSIDFAFFLLSVFFLYWFVSNKSYKTQNILLLVASYFFYACWDWRFLFLLVFSTFLDYFSGLKMSKAKNDAYKKVWFWLSVSINLGFLGVFKYYNFFAQSFSDAISNFGLQINPWTLKVILPVGISFYTFHGLSYLIDIYKNKIKPENDFIAYSVFVSFFPLLVAGPIERATHLLPQIKKERKFDYAKSVDGLRQILWGLFKKIVIADRCADYTNIIFNNSAEYSGSTLLLGAVFFSFQIYGDFSGYSDIALGTARLFGIDLLRNFAFPYFSRDIAEFWRRWHISLSSWFKDYLYIPLGGSKVKMWRKISNTFIIFLVSGFWHGASWTFIFWGFLNALYIMPSIVFNTNRNNLTIVAEGKYFPTIKEFLQMGLTFFLTTIAWIFFRAENLTSAFGFIFNIFNSSFFKIPAIKNDYPIMIFAPCALIIMFMSVEWIGRHGEYAIQNMDLIKHKKLRWSIYILLALAILLSQGKVQNFIYFQF